MVAASDTLDPKLPAAPATLLVLRPGDLVDRLEAAGYRVEPLGDEGSPQDVPPGETEPSGTLVQGALVDFGRELTASSRADTLALLRRLRERLEDSAPLVVRAAAETAAAGAARALLLRLRASLLESWFVVMEEEILEDGSLRLVARASGHRVRPYAAGDEVAILDLFERAFHHRRGLERWRWAYEEAPEGSHRISVAEDREGRLRAHYAGYPVRFWSDLPGLVETQYARASTGGGRTLPALHIGDTMTAPEARRVGRGRTNLLTRTVSHFYATFCHDRVAFNYGTNTGKIQRFSRRTAGAERVEDAPFRVRDVEAPVAAPGPLGALLGGWRVERLAGARDIDGCWDELWERSRGAYRFLVQRDRRYLAWRYDCPGVEYELWAVFRRGRLVGWSAFRRQGEALFWGDALFDPRHPGAAAILLSRLLASPVHRDVRRLEAWFPERPEWWNRILIDLGFVRQPEPEDLGLVYVPFGVDPFEAMARELYYTKADFDLF